MKTRRFQEPRVAEIFDSFPSDIRRQLMSIREMIFSVGCRLGGLDTVQETIKWGEPSYTTVAGSTVRLGWKKTDPERHAIYFHCGTSLVSTFRKLYANTFLFERNRAIIFQKGEKIPSKEVKQCIELALTYHRRKHLPLLGAKNETRDTKSVLGASTKAHPNPT